MAAAPSVVKRGDPMEALQVRGREGNGGRGEHVDQDSPTAADRRLEQTSDRNRRPTAAEWMREALAASGGQVWRVGDKHTMAGGEREGPPPPRPLTGLLLLAQPPPL